ncbi:MAG TPA: thiol:disulfide interchange protein DsbA/DsbL [Burkholderiales bacterium]|nr:thiol:disulfide interchange protein DsbA/DsbL [Burkholderiales bacterium]
MKRILSLLLAACALAPLAAAAQPQFAYSEVKPAVPVETDGKIEVVEFFWYGCIHCYNLEPAVEKWEKTLPKDVQFRRVPAVFNDRWAIDASIFYTLEAMGLLDRLHRPLFDAIHRERLRTDNQKEVMDWLQKQGVDQKKFTETMKSFGVQSKMRRAAQLTALYKIDGTPAMAVNGRYTVSTEQGRSQNGMFETVNYLVDTIRKGGK